MSERSFDRMPTVGGAWLRALLPKRGLRGDIPRIEASVVSHRAEPAWLDAYCRVTGASATGTLPPGAPQALALPLHMAVLTAPEFPLPLLGAVHVRQRIDVVRALRVDEAPSARCWVEGKRQARRGVEVDLHTEWSVGGAVAWHGVTTFLSRTGGTGEAGARAVAPAGEAPPPVPPFAATWSLPEDLGRRFAKVAGDRNPIHMYWWTARPFGFHRPIVHGMWTLARVLASLESTTPLEGVCISCSFRKPLPLPGIASGLAWRDGNQERFIVRDGKGRDALVGTIAPL